MGYSARRATMTMLKQKTPGSVIIALRKSLRANSTFVITRGTIANAVWLCATVVYP